MSRLNFIALSVVTSITWILLISTILFSCKAKAADFELGALLGSYHFDRESDYNEKNKGLLLTVNNDYQVIYFKNSHYDNTLAAGYKFDYQVTGWLEISVTTGAVYGYGLDDNNRLNDATTYGARLLPWIIPAATIHYKNFTATTHFFGAGFAQSIGYRF